jgi:flagellar biosynthesis protein FlhF
MRIRTFLAKDMKEALAAMRAELGDEAIIIARETMKDGSVLLRAGVEAQLAPELEAAEDCEPGPAATVETASFESLYRGSLVARLRNEAANTARAMRPLSREALLAALHTHRTPDGLAQSVTDAAEASGLADLMLALAAGLDTFMRSGRADSSPSHALLLIGPPGAGKTAVAAKLAAQQMLAGCAVRLAACDLESAGQAARLESFAASLDLPFVAAPTADRLSQAIAEAEAEGALLIADSAGFDARGELPCDLLPLLSLGRLEIAGVVSAAYDAEEAGEIAGALEKLGATKLIATGLDLTRRKGALLTLACSGLGLAQVTASPYLAAGLQRLTPIALARAILADGNTGEIQNAA